MSEVARVTEIALASGEVITVDEGMRRWYEGCACCLRDTYPEVKKALDAERKALRRAAEGDPPRPRAEPASRVRGRLEGWARGAMWTARSTEPSHLLQSGKGSLPLARASAVHDMRLVTLRPGHGVHSRYHSPTPSRTVEAGESGVEPRT